MLIDLEIVSVQQFVSAAPSWLVSNCVGSSHFDGRDEPPYIYENLWLRFELAIPRKLKSFTWSASYGTPYNGPEYVRDQIFGWSFGTTDAPGEGGSFTWDVGSKTGGPVTREMRISKGTAWFWLTYDFAGQNNCYVDGVSLAAQGEPVGSMRVWNGVEFIEGTPHVAVNGRLLEGEAYICRGGVWQPGN